jgi:hypothetical protein
MAKDCLRWAREARADNVRDAYIEFARLWTEAASIIPERTQGSQSQAAEGSREH